MSPRTGMWVVVAAALALLAVVTVVPAIDLDASRAFYVPGRGFPWRTNEFGVVVRRHGPEILLASAAVCLVLWLVGMWQKRVVLGLTARKIFYLLATLLIGPGLIVETLLKPHSGRARPQDLAMFGGSADYTAPLSLTDACASNCSFVSGHAAVAFWITAYAFIVPREMRWSVLALGLLIGVAVGAVRVMQGAHFVSDVVYAGAIVLAVNVLLARLILADKNNGAA
jgi:lipid A 4'-phosphatase